MQTHVVQLVVEPASVADRLARLIPSPESRSRRLAVGAAGARSSRRTLQRQFWKREDTDITPVTLAFQVLTIVPRSSLSAKFNLSNMQLRYLALLKFSPIIDIDKKDMK